MRFHFRSNNVVSLTLITTGLVLVGMMVAGLVFIPGQSWADRPGNGDPVPIPGGIQVPDGPFIHTFLPGPESLGYMGLDVDPTVISDFRGFTAMAYMGGRATDTEGKDFDLAVDLRVFRGDYIDADGDRSRGTFGFI